MLDKDIMKLDLHTLEVIKFGMEIYSDGTVFSMGYRRLCEIVEQRKKLEENATRR